MSEEQIRECLERFSEAWARHDIDAFLDMMTVDAVYAASIGPEPGTTFRGREQIAEGLATMFKHDDGATILASEPTIFEGGAISTWTYRFEGVDRPDELGVDIWQFRDGKVSLKDAYRKMRVAR